MKQIVDNKFPAALYLCMPLLVLFFTSLNLYAADDFPYWQAIGPEGAPINSFRMKQGDTEIIDGLDVQSDGAILATFRSFNNGKSWVALPAAEGKQPSVNRSNIHTIARDTKNPDILYAETIFPEFVWGKHLDNTYTLYKSIDGGLNWVTIEVPDVEYRGNFSMSQEQSETLYATFRFSSSSPFESRDKVMVSDNAGKDWQLLAPPGEGENLLHADVTKVYLDPVDSKILYAKLYGHKMHYKNYGYNTTHFAKSYDSGDSWEVIDVAPYQLIDLVINRHNNQQLLMAYGAGVLRSENGGLDWVPSNTGVKKVGGVLSVVEGQNNLDVMYINLGGLHYKTTDGGLHWQAFRTHSPVTRSCTKFTINPVNSHEILCPTWSGLFRSVDSGENWDIQPLGDNFRAVIYANDGKTLYSYRKFVREPLRKSIDNGLSWKNVRDISNESGQGLLFTGVPKIDPRNPNIIYSSVFHRRATGGFKELYKSINGGDNWKLLVSEAIDGEARLIMHPQNPDLLIYSIGQKSFWRSENGGESWLKTLQQFIRADRDFAREFVFDPVNLQGLYEWDGRQVQYSADRGVTWSVVGNGLEEVERGSLISASGDMFFSSGSYLSKGIFKLSRKTKTGFSSVSDCLFAWAEKEYPDLFASGTSSTQQWGGYVYRYFKQSNIYLGFLYQQEVHIKQADSSSKIGVVGSVAFYQELSGCY